jgi:hypothetical protein
MPLDENSRRQTHMGTQAFSFTASQEAQDQLVKERFRAPGGDRS